MENTTPLVANFLKLPQRTFPPLLRFAIIIKQSSDPEGTKNKILEEGMEYELTQGDEVQRSLKEMSIIELRTALKDLGLKVTGKKQDLVNRLIGAQSTRGKDRNGRRESKTQKVKGSISPMSPATSPLPSGDSAKQAKEEETTVTEQIESKEAVKVEEEPSEPKEEIKESDTKTETNESTGEETRSLTEADTKEVNEDEDDDEVSESTSPYAKFKVTDLRNELRKRGLNTAGRKDELIDRLEADNAASTSKSVSPSNSQEKIDVSNPPQADSLAEVDPTSPTGSASVSTPPVSTSPPTSKLSPSKAAKRNSQAIDQKAKRKGATQGADSEEEGDSSDVVDDDDTDEYDDGESRRKKKVEGTKTNKSSKGKGGRRDSRTAKRRRRDF